MIGEGAAARLKGGMRRNEACVDNELAVLPLRVIQPAINGNIGNPVYQESDPDAIHPLQGVLMVGRLDGPDLKTCLGLIEKVRNAEKRGLWGRVYIDHRGIKWAILVRGSVDEKRYRGIMGARIMGGG